MPTIVLVKVIWKQVSGIDSTVVLFESKSESIDRINAIQSQKDLIDTYELLLTRNVTIKLP